MPGQGPPINGKIKRKGGTSSAKILDQAIPQDGDLGIESGPCPGQLRRTK